MKNNIRRLRLAQNLTQIDLAAASGLTQQQIQRAETAPQHPRFDMAVRIARGLGKPVDQVFPLPDDLLGVPEAVAPAAEDAPAVCTLELLFGDGSAWRFPLTESALAMLAPQLNEGSDALLFCSGQRLHVARPVLSCLLNKVDEPTGDVSETDHSDCMQILLRTGVSRILVDVTPDTALLRLDEIRAPGTTLQRLFLGFYNSPDFRAVVPGTPASSVIGMSGVIYMSAPLSFFRVLAVS